MKRREFITLLGSAAAWPLAARAQERLWRVGALMNLPADDQEAQLYIAAFQQGLKGLGWSIGATCGSITVGARLILRAFARRRRNWSRSRRTL
jgi:hypothetical protein